VGRAHTRTSLLLPGEVRGLSEGETGRKGGDVVDTETFHAAVGALMSAIAAAYPGLADWDAIRAIGAEHGLSLEELTAALEEATRLYSGRPQ
jgi:phage tail protein X